MRRPLTPPPYFAVEEELDPSKEQILVLNNGCLCCTVRDDLVEMLHRLVRPAPEHCRTGDTGDLPCSYVMPDLPRLALLEPWRFTPRAFPCLAAPAVRAAFRVRPRAD